MFDIEFICDDEEVSDEGCHALGGRITIGEYSEEFLATIHPWTRSQYECQWIEAAQRMVDGSDRTAFFTSAFQFWWVMWLEGENIFVHEELILEDQAVKMLAEGSYKQIGDRVIETDDGAPISEWHLKLQDIRDFVIRREKQYGGI